MDEKEKNLPEEVPTVNEDTTAGQQEAAASAEETQENISSGKGHKKRTIIIVAVVLIVVIALLAIQKCKTGTVAAQAGPVYAQVDENGTAYLPMSGKVITIEGNVSWAVLTADRKHIVVQTVDDTLYVTDTRQSERHEILSEFASVYYIKDDGFIYQDLNGECYRVLYSEMSSTPLGELDDCISADNSISLLYAVNGKIYSIPSFASEGTEFGNYNSTVELKSVSNDGELAVWVDHQETVVSDQGEVSHLDGLSVNASDVNVTFSAQQELMMIGSSECDCLYLKRSGEAELVKVNLAGDCIWDTFYTKTGKLSKSSVSKNDEIYVAVDGDKGANVYCIASDGERERVLSGVADFSIFNGTIFYIDADDNLYRAKLDGANVTDEVKISTEVDGIYLTESGKYLYYGRDGKVYCCKSGETNAVKVPVEEDTTEARFTTDGSVLYYFTDIESIPDSSYDCGTLMRWNYGAESADKVTSDVLVLSVFSDTMSSEALDKDNVIFAKYDHVDKSGMIYADWMSYDGKQVGKIVSDQSDSFDFMMNRMLRTD